MLEIKDISKNYGDVAALDHFSLVLKEGLYGFLGENGAGKSTLIKLLSCNLIQDSGEILWDGEDIRRLGEKYRACIGYMPQETVGYERMRVKAFMEYMAVLKGMNAGTKEVQQEIQLLLEQVHLEQATRKRFGQLSGGMKRRLLFAQAVLGNPQLIILDEPTAGLDPNERIALRNMISKISLQRTVILATHIISDIECVSNQIVLMKKGKMLGVHDPEYWLEQTRGRVKEFICSMDEVEAAQEKYVISNMRQEADGIHVRVVGDTFEAGLEWRDVMPSLDDVYLYFQKMEHI